MITVLVLAAVTAVIASGFLFRSAQEAKLATRSFFQSAALNLAEAGAEEALLAVNSTAVNSANGWSLATGSTTDYTKTLTGFTFQQATGAVYIRIDNAATAAPTITAAAVISIPKQPPLLKQVRLGGSVRRLWSNGLVAKGSVTFSGSAYVDGYDSNLGPYNAATNRNDRGAVATNSSAMSSVSLGGTAYIYGYVSTGGGDPNPGTSGRIYGVTSPPMPLIDSTRVRKDFNTNLPDATVPTGTPIALGNVTIAGIVSQTYPRAGDVAGANGRYLYSCSVLDMSHSAAIQITGPVDFIVTGNTTVAGSAYIGISSTSTASFNLFCPGAISIGGGGMINNTVVPSKATIWGTTATGATPQTISVAGASSFVGTVYAPNGNVTVANSGGVHGAIISNTATLSGVGFLHYDVRLGNSAGPTAGLGSGSGYLRVSSWCELDSAPSSGNAFARDSREPFAGLF